MVYDELYRAWIKEKENAELQRLPEHFYSEIIRYLSRIRKEGRMLDQRSSKAKLTSRELSNATRLVEELLHLRFEKIVKRVASQPLEREALATEEETILKGLVDSTTRFQHFMKETLQGKSSRFDEHRQASRVMLRFLEKTPAIAGADLKVYGPFSVEDVATLPLENARVLVKHGVAVEIDTQ